MMREKYLEVSTVEADEGNLVGRHPKSLSREELEGLVDHEGNKNPHSPIKAIRAKCIDCCVGDKSEVRKCVALKCPLWAFRMGSNVYHGRGPSND